MKIDVDHDGGVLISGTWDELDDFSDSLREVLFQGSPGDHPAGSLLTDEGVVSLVLRLENG